MKYSDDLIIGESVRDRADIIKKDIESYSVDESQDFIVTAPANPENMFDIIPVRELRLSVYHLTELCILGLAGSKDEAVEIVRQLIEKQYN